MYLHGHDWKGFAALVEEKRLPSSGELIKVHATDVNPLDVLDPRKYGSLAVIWRDSREFEPDVVYDYPDRGVYIGSELEEELRDRQLSPPIADAVRALFRLASDMGSVSRAMGAEALGPPL